MEDGGNGWQNIHIYAHLRFLFLSLFLSCIFNFINLEKNPIPKIRGTSVEVCGCYVREGEEDSRSVNKFCKAILVEIE